MNKDIICIFATCSNGKNVEALICMEEAQTMGNNIAKTMENIKRNIGKCEILSNALISKLQEEDIDIDRYIQKGYSEDEVILGIEIIELYLELVALVEKSNLTLPALKSRDKSLC